MCILISCSLLYTSALENAGLEARNFVRTEQETLTHRLQWISVLDIFSVLQGYLHTTGSADKFVEREIDIADQEC